MLKLELYRKSDHTEFKKYITEAFHKKYILGDPRYLDWQYKNSLYLLKADNKIIGHFGFRDLKYKVGSRSKTVRVLINLFVLEKFRTFGFGTMLIKKVLGNFWPALVAGYRLPAMKVFGRYKPDWKEGILERYMAIVNKATKYEINTNIRKKSSVTISKPKNFNKKEINEWWKKIRRQFPVTIERGYDYFAWRFFYHPFFDYRILSARRNNKLSGILIWRPDGERKYKMGRIVDFIAEKESAAELLKAFLYELRKEKIKFGEFLLSGNFYKPALRSAGFFDVRGTRFENYPVLLNPVSFKRHNINIAHTLGAGFENCYFTKAEGDQDRANPH